MLDRRDGNYTGHAIVVLLEGTPIYSARQSAINLETE